MKDKEILKAIELETKRQKEQIELIASENFVSEDVLAATGSILTNKYAEGYPGKRYYDGTECVDKVETIAIDRLKKIFGVKYANVQPHSGSSANFEAIAALLGTSGKILGMDLPSGGHLTHGHKVNFSGMFYESHTYGVDERGYIDYDAVEKIAMEIKPDLIICGYSAYPRTIDFKRFKQIADKCGAKLMADIAHIAGLIATGKHPTPVGYADIITSTTHKTLRGARGGIIMTNSPEIAKAVDKIVFPGMQGGPLMHSIAGKAVAFYEAMQPAFAKYIDNVIEFAQKFAERLITLGATIISGGTDNHMFTIDVKTSYGITGKEASTRLHESNITVNKNTIPNDTESPMITSGIRIGTPAMTTKGFKLNHWLKLAEIIHECLSAGRNMKDEVAELVASI